MAYYECGTCKPGRNLLSAVCTPDRTSTSWTRVQFSTTAYDPDGTGVTTLCDPKFAHFDANGYIIVDYDCVAYLSAAAYRGVTSSGTAVYSGIDFYQQRPISISDPTKGYLMVKNTQLLGASGSANPTTRRQQYSLKAGDRLFVNTKVTSTTQAYCKTAFTLTWAG